MLSEPRLTALPARTLLLRLFSILVAIAALTCGARAVAVQAYRFEGRPFRALHPEFEAQLRTVLQKLPEGACLFHLSTVQEDWFSRLWQRALYPRNDMILVQPPLTRERIQSLRDRYGVRYAISFGDPPLDPGFLWKVDLGRLPLVHGTDWFGELAP